MNRLLILSILFCCFCSIANGQATKQSFKLGYLSKIPNEIDGCSELYTYDSVSLKKDKYIFISNMQELAFIKINGKQITLNKVSEKKLPKNIYKSIYKGAGYIITLTLKSQKLVDEVSFNNGTIEIAKGAFKLVIKIHGEAGC